LYQHGSVLCRTLPDGVCTLVVSLYATWVAGSQYTCWWFQFHYTHHRLPAYSYLPHHSRTDQDGLRQRCCPADLTPLTHTTVPDIAVLQHKPDGFLTTTPADGLRFHPTFTGGTARTTFLHPAVPHVPAVADFCVNNCAPTRYRVAILDNAV